MPEPLLDIKKTEKRVLELLSDNKERSTRDLIDKLFPKRHRTAYLYRVLTYILDKLSKKGLVLTRSGKRDRINNRYGKANLKKDQTIKLWRMGASRN